MPDQSYFFTLTIGADSRIDGEVVTTPQHRYTRMFDYPGRSSPGRDIPVH